METIDLDAAARFFSHSVVRDLATRGRSALLGRLANQSGLLSRVAESECVGALFERAFDALRGNGYRDEYTYQDAITRQILLRRHSLATASMIPEFRVGPCKADLVIFNGTSTAYEIKSERDNLDRIESQLAAYLDVFARVCVVAGKNHVETIQNKLPKIVGIMVLDESNKLHTVREPTDNKENVRSTSIFECLRVSEAVETLRMLRIRVPVVPNTEIYRTLRPIFAELDGSVVHDCVVKVLKKSRSATMFSESLKRLPYSLRTAALLTQLSASGHSKLASAVNRPAHSVASWV